MSDSEASNDITAFVDSHSINDPPVYSQERDALGRRSSVNDSADDIDPRRLVRDPSPSELRWYCRNTPYAPTAVKKPIKDATKHGFEITNDPTGKAQEFLDTYDEHRETARIKARRDGFSFLFFKYNDRGSVSQQPDNVNGVAGFDVLTLDDLDDGMNESEVAEYVEYGSDQIHVRDTGIVVVRDIRLPEDEQIVGVVYEIDNQEPMYEAGSSHVFIHGDRLQHFVENPEVDGPLYDDPIVGQYADDWLGHVEGHSVLGPVFHQVKALAKANWAIGQTLFRYTSPLHVIKTPDNLQDPEDHIENLNDNLNNLNAASEITLPPEHEMETHGADGEMDPEPYKDALIEMFCAGTEMTKSVLQGTQSGTVSGSETDIKNYFNQVERYRQNTAERKMREACKMVSRFDKSTVPTFALGFEVEWGPLFKPDSLDRTESAFRVAQTLTNGINNYVLTPEEARSILQEQWAKLDIDIDLDELSERDMDQLDRINQTQVGASKGSEEAEIDPQGNPQTGQNGGGMEQGQTTGSSNPSN